MTDLTITTPATPAPATEATIVTAWLAQRPATTRRAYEGDYRAFRAVCDAPLRLVTLPDLQAFAAALTDKAAASQARTLTAIKSLFTFAHTLGYLPVNIGAALRLPKVRNDLAARIVDRDAVAVMLAAERNPRNKALLTVLYYAGLRISEVASLRWCDLQPRDAGKVQVTVFGKGGKTRTILLPSRAWAVLEPLRGDAGDDAPVFLSREGGALDVRQIARVVKAAAARAGLPAAFSAHWLRHACASHSLDSGAPAHVVQQTLGHASLSTTSRYAHARPCDSAALYLDR